MDDYVKVLKKTFGYDNFRDKQLEIIKAVLEDKKDVCSIMFTGAGKSLCFQFPAVYSEKTAIVVSPLISLMNDQLKKMEKLNISTVCLNSTVYNKNTLKESILENEYRLVYITPEYLITQETFIKELNETNNLIGFYIDEAHCISMYGNDFRESYKQLDCLRDWCPEIPIIALTATATQLVQDEIIESLNLRDPLLIRTTFDRPNLVIKVNPKSGNFVNDILNVMNKDDSTIIYCQTRKMTENISDKLKEHDINCDIYHAGMTSAERKEVHQKFIDNKLKCIIATIAFGMGVDFTIRKVIHYGIPKNIESYYQEIGRAGRDGLKSECYLFYSMNDMKTNNYFISQIEDKEYRDHMVQLSLTMKSYIFTSNCRRKYILDYFNETYTKDNCETCDNCLNKKNIKINNFAKEAKLIFETLKLTNGTYGAVIITNIIRGSESKKMLDRFKESKVYGKGTKYPEKWWRYLIAILINNQYIQEKAISHGNSFTLSMTTKALRWLKEYDKDNKIELKLQTPKEMDSLIKPQKAIVFKNIDLVFKKKHR